MTLMVINAGLQSTLQAGPNMGYRHIGMPHLGAADPLSLALANRLMNKPYDATAIEISLSATEFLSNVDMAFAITGGPCRISVDGKAHAPHQRAAIRAGETLSIGPIEKGARAYLALSRDIRSDVFLGNASTYLTAKLGGFEGRSLQMNDQIQLGNLDNLGHGGPDQDNATPPSLRPHFSHDFLLRVCPGPEWNALNKAQKEHIASTRWRISSRSNRMGLALEGGHWSSPQIASMDSAPVFPGTIQLPPDGTPYLLGPDAQTTGGYPRILQVIRADRHLIGQLPQGSNVTLLITSPEKAAILYQNKCKLIEPWLGKFPL